MHGGVKFYRGSAAAARSYVEADHSRADDYYLAEGSGVAERLRRSTPERVRASSAISTARPTSGGSPGTTSRPARPRDGCVTTTRALRFVEVVVNGPKTWSLAAALHPEIAAAYDAAMDRGGR